MLAFGRCGSGDHSEEGGGHTAGSGKKRSSRLKGISRWQALLGAVLAAVITAGGGVWAAYVASSGGGAAAAVSPTHTTESSRAASCGGGYMTAPVDVAISSWSEAPRGSVGVQYVFTGTVDGSGWQEIYVIVQSASVPADAAIAGANPWLVSPRAVLVDCEHWKVVWNLPSAPKDARWTAVAMSGPALPTCGASATSCGPVPPDLQLARGGPSVGLGSTSALPAAQPSSAETPTSCPLTASGTSPDPCAGG